MVPDAVLVDLAEEVGEGLLSEAAHAPRRQLDAPALLLDQPGVGQRLGEVGQPVQRPRRVLAHVLLDLLEVDLAQGGRGGGRLEHLFHAVELAQLRGQVGGPVQGHGPLAVEVVGTLPAGVGHGTLEVLGQALHLPAQVHVLEHGLHELAQLGLLLGAERVPHGLGGGHALGQLLEELVERLRVAREHVAVLLHELLEAGIELLPAFALLEHLVEGVVGVPHARHLLGAHARERLGRALEEGVGHLPPELFDELLEALPCLGGDEVVVLQAADAPGRVVGLEVERHAALGGHVVGHLAAPLVARAVRLLHELVDGGALVLLDLVELPRELGHAAVGVALGEHLLAAAAQLVEEVSQAGDLVAVGSVEAAAQETTQRVVEVTAGEEVVGEPRQEVVGVEVGELLGAVPFRVVVAGAHGLVPGLTCARGRGRGRRTRPCSTAWSDAGPRGGIRGSWP